MRATAVSVLTLVACSSGPREQIKIGPTPPPTTRAVLAGPLCGGEGRCTCRDESKPGDGGAGAPEAGTKRFEVKLGPVDGELWTTIGDHVLYKSKERPTECFYVDLPPGKHEVTLRASKPEGARAALAISELGVAAGSWYKTFRFSCGVPGPCSHDELSGKKAEYRRYKAGLHDNCGSVRIKQLTWDSGVAPDTIHPQELVVGLTLDVYKFLPGKPSGDPACGTGNTAVEPGEGGDAPAPADDGPDAISGGP
jgi:hypothetical protein